MRPIPIEKSVDLDQTRLKAHKTRAHSICICVQGIAGNDTTMIAAPAPKHFSCYCGPENWGGIYRWTFDAVVPEKYLTSYFFPGWRTAIGTGKVRGPMCSYNRCVLLIL